MKITILNGDMNKGENGFTDYVNIFSKKLEEQGHSVDHFKLHDMDLHFCTGCWTCWWKTPGQCTLKDDGEQVLRSVINADFFVFASPLMAGFTSSRLKLITDRLVGLLHPYVEIHQGEYHHRKRYERYPDFGLILEREDDTDEEDIQIVRDIYKRFSINFHNSMKYLMLTDQESMDEIVHRTSALSMHQKLPEETIY